MSESKKSREQVEREQMTRRQALRKFGFGAGMSALMLLTADDLARMVGDRLRQMDGDNKVADQIAREFQNAGIALARPPGQPPLPGGCAANATGAAKAECCSEVNVAKWCQGYGDTPDCRNCCNGVYGSDGWCAGYDGGPESNKNGCWNDCSAIPVQPTN